MILRLARRLGGLGLATALALGLLASPATTPPARAAAPDLTIVGDATYTVQPEQHRVRVNVTLVLTNRLKDTVTAAANRQHTEPLAFISNEELFGDLAGDKRFTTPYLDALNSLHQKSSRATLQMLVG